MATDDAPAAENSGGSAKRQRRRGRPFSKGASGNPGGRPRRADVIPEFLSEVVKRKGRDGKAVEAPRRQHLLQVLYELALNGGHGSQLKAIELWEAYDLGRPRERLEMSGPRGGPIATEDVTRRRRATSGEMRKELAAIEERRRQRLAVKRQAAGPGPAPEDAPGGTPDDDTT